MQFFARSLLCVLIWLVNGLIVCSFAAKMIKISSLLATASICFVHAQPDVLTGVLSGHAPKNKHAKDTNSTDRNFMGTPLDF